MKLSTKGRYGARAAIELALQYGQGPMMVREIAEKQQISDRYLEHILNALRAAGLVKSTRGAHGGYELSRAPERITIGEVVAALEGPLDIVACTAEEHCPRAAECVMNEVWIDARKALEGVLGTRTLGDLAGRHRTLMAAAAATTPDYTI